MAAIFYLSLPVSSDGIGSMDYMSSVLTDLGNLGVTLEFSTIQAYIQCTSGLAAAILDLLLPITSDNVHAVWTIGLASWVTLKMYG